MVRGLTRQILKLYVVYVKGTDQKKGAIPAACLHHALFKELPAGS